MSWFKKAATGSAALVILVGALKHHEGIKTDAYQDVVGVWTICYGETKGVYKGMSLTEKECDQLLKSRAKGFMDGVQDILRVKLSPDTLAAHTHFAYNIGLGGYTRSTVRRLTNDGDIEGGCHAMMRWNVLTIKGVRYNCSKPENLKNINGCRGIMNRREFERDLCLSGI